MDFQWLSRRTGPVLDSLRPVAILAQGDVAVDELEGVLEKTAAIAQAAL